MCTTDYYCENCTTLCSGIIGLGGSCDAGCSNHSKLCQQCGQCDSCVTICPDCKKAYEEFMNCGAKMKGGE